MRRHRNTNGEGVCEQRVATAAGSLESGSQAKELQMPPEAGERQKRKKSPPTGGEHGPVAP